MKAFYALDIGASDVFLNNMKKNPLPELLVLLKSI